MEQTAFLADPARDNAGRLQTLAALAVCAVAGLLTILLLPIAARLGPVIPSFILINQTSLFIAYTLGAWVLFRQFRRSGTFAICILAGGTLYTAAIILLQLLSFPGVATNGRVIGSGPETTTWLWTFWHIGPPACALAYA